MAADGVGIDVDRARAASGALEVLKANPVASAAIVRGIAARADLDTECRATVAGIEALAHQLAALGEWFDIRADLASGADSLTLLPACGSSTNALLRRLDTVEASLGGATRSGVVSDVVGELWEFLAGDVANLWNGGGESFPIGQLGAGGIRMWRTFVHLRGGPLPVFNTGLVGRTLATAMTRSPTLAPAGRWLGTPGATAVFRVAGIAGGAVSTGIGVYDLYRQGNPIDAFQREGAGYVADVASTAFSASTTAFLVAPNPVTGALVVGSGLVWAGAEVVGHWDDISGWTVDRWDDVTGTAWAMWDVGTSALTGTIDVGADLVSGAWDAGTGFIGDVGGGLVSFAKDWF